MVGTRYGDRVIVETLLKKDYGNATRNKTFHKVICDNDHVSYIKNYDVVKGISKKCWKCRSTNSATYNVSTHPLYGLWGAMKDRCLSPNNQNYKYYGGRGISIDPLWMDFAVFVEDVGERPEGMSLDRINNDGNYEPGNVRWATAKEQSLNSRKPERHSVDFTGKRFGKWLVVKECELDKKGNRTWECICECGFIKLQTSNRLRTNTSLQCLSCYRKQFSEMNKKHLIQGK